MSEIPNGGHHYDFHMMRCPLCHLTAEEAYDGHWHVCRDAGAWPREVKVPQRSIQFHPTT